MHATPDAHQVSQLVKAKGRAAAFPHSAAGAHGAAPRLRAGSPFVRPRRAASITRMALGSRGVTMGLIFFASDVSELIGVAEAQLSGKLAGRLDGEDVVQSVFRTFFRRSAAGEFQVDASDQLWRLLLTITLRKVRAKARRETAEKRDAGAEAAGD